MINEFIHTDLPDPVEPATSKCGVLERSAIQLLPLISFPKETGSFIDIISFCLSWITSLTCTPTVILLGISTPTVVLPGIGASIRTSLAARDKAISLDNPVILLTFVPFFTATSNWVTVGPSWTATTFPVIPKSARTFCKAILVCLINSSLLVRLFFFNGSKTSSSFGKR